MSAVLILDLSNASARSKGQALRRLQPNLSEEARKARRKLVRQTRSESKKLTEQSKILLSKKPSETLHRPQSHIHPASLGHSRLYRSQSPLQVEHPALASSNQGYDSLRTIPNEQHSRYLTDQNQKQIDKDDFLLPSQDDLQLCFNTVGKATEADEVLERDPPYDGVTETDARAYSKEDQALMMLLGLPDSPPDWNAGYVRGLPGLPDTQLALGFTSTTQSIDRDVEDFALTSNVDSHDWYQCCRNPLCEYAYKIFHSKSRRDQHLLGHHGTLMMCGFCSIGETSPLYLKELMSHLRTEHSMWELVNDVNEQDSFRAFASTCSTCPELFRTAQGFAEHLEACVVRHLEQRSPQRWVDLMLKSDTEDHIPNEERAFPVYGPKYLD